MIISTKNTILALLIIAILGGIVFAVSSDRERTELIQDEDSEKETADMYKDQTITVSGKKIPYINNSTRDSILADIQETGGEGYEEYSVRVGGPKDKIMLAYNPPFSEEDKTREGIMVIELDENSEPRVLWEVNSAMFGEIVGDFDVRDINNDGVNEILSWWKVGVRWDSEILLIFTYEEPKYILINPIENVYGRLPGNTDAIVTGIDLSSFPSIPVVGDNLFGGQEVSVIDIDNDQVDEVIIENNYYEEGEEIPPGFISLGPDRIVTTYKWDGKQFYFWKEEREKIE